jgi:hypothetical protein
VKERIYWPIWLSFLVIALDLSIVVAVWAGLGNFSAIICMVICAALTVFFFIFSGLKITLTADELLVSRARIERKFIGSVEVLNQKDMKRLRGPEINPNAFLAIRFWVKEGVKINLSDPKDPTPYWLVSSSQPKRLAKLINS